LRNGAQHNNRINCNDSRQQLASVLNNNVRTTTWQKIFGQQTVGYLSLF